MIQFVTQLTQALLSPTVKNFENRSTFAIFMGKNTVSCRVQPGASCKHRCASVTKQYNLVPTNGR